MIAEEVWLLGFSLRERRGLGFGTSGCVKEEEEEESEKERMREGEGRLMRT